MCDNNIYYDVISVYFTDLDTSVYGVLAEDAIATKQHMLELEHQGQKYSDEYHHQANALAEFVSQLRDIAVSTKK